MHGLNQVRSAFNYGDTESERVEQVFVRHVFRYWMGRNETIEDAPVLQDKYSFVL